ncbi:MAG: glycine betaine/L-proline transporter ProP [Acuticoccus sp.]
MALCYGRRDQVEGAMAHTSLGRRGVAAAVSGNLLEWYDFTIYGFLAPILATLFFPSGDHTAALLASFATLAVGYAARPLGSVIFGHVGDRFGRKPAMVVSVALMGAGSLALALLPTYAAVGIAAPILLLVVRIVQGIAVAGEYTASGILLVEGATARRRFFVGSWIPFAMGWGCVLGSGVPAALSGAIGETAMHEWGWRVPFFLGAGVGFVSLALRAGIEEPPPADDMGAPDGSPVRAALARHWGVILKMVGLMAPAAIVYFMVFVYAASYLTDVMHLSTAAALDITTANLVVVAVLSLLAGVLADRLGYRRVLFIAAAGTVLLALPLWRLMHVDDLRLIFLGQFGFAAFSAMWWGLSMTVLAGLVPAAVRCSAVAIGYNSAMAIFGGTTPFVATWLVARTADDMVPAYYAMAACAVSLAIVPTLPKFLAFGSANGAASAPPGGRDGG